MKRFVGEFLEFLEESAGQDGVEYALLLGSVALAAAATLLTLGASISALWDRMNALLSSPD